MSRWRSGRYVGLGLMSVAGGWLIYDSTQLQNASFPPKMNTGGSLLPILVFVLGAAIFARDTYFKWRDDQRAEKSAGREEERFRRESAD
jgi:hypothetical protein